MNALLAALSVLLCAAVALAVPGGSGALAVCVVAALVAGILLWKSSNEYRFLLQIFVVGLLVRVLIGTVIYHANLQEFFGGDAFTYDALGADLLMSWQRKAIGGEPLGHFTLGGGWGMPYIVASIYWLVGRNMLAVQLFNAVLGAATAPVIFHCARHIFTNLRVAKLSALLVALYPSLVLWSSQGLKDGPIVFLLALVMLATLRLGDRLSVTNVLLLGSAMFAILTLRFYVFYMVAAAVGGSLLIGLRPLTSRSILRQFAVIVAVGLALTYLGVLRTAGAQFEAYGNLEAVQRSRADLAQSARSGFGQDVDVSTTAGALTAVPTGMVYLLFAPFPWQLASLRQSITLPEMVMWWASFPLLVLGIYFTVRYRLRQALPILIFTAMLTLAYSVFQGNVGTAYRQRSQILVFYFMFVGVGAVLVKERSEERDRQVASARRVVTPAQRAAEARRRYEQWKQGRERELEKITRDVSERLTS
jgi:hypothetical protein